MNNRSYSEQSHPDMYNNHTGYYNNLKSPHPQLHSPPCISRDILEVTSNRGDVGFVAVRRMVNYETPETLDFPYPYGPQYFHDHRRENCHDLYPSDAVPRLDVAHTRHKSEPALQTNEPRRITTDHNFAEKASTGDAKKSSNRARKTKKQGSSKTQEKQQGNLESMSNTKSSASKKHPTSAAHNSATRTIPSNSSEEATPTLPSARSSDDSVAAALNRLNVDDVATNSSATNSQSFVNANPLCKVCGQRHRLCENHEYDYVEEVDDDLQCDICLQPFVDPFDTRCGHTFCSICLKNYVQLKKMCPIDRKEMEFTSSDCWQSSVVMRKLVDKLTVYCPNTEHCKLSLPRTELADHLKERCPGTVLRCSFAMFGCSFKGARQDRDKHVKKCKFQHHEGDPVESIYPDCVKHTVELFRPEGIAELGIAVIGGNDTPIRNVIVQSIIPGSLVAEDGRIDAGDIIIEVNGEDLHNVSHVEARAVLSRSSRLMRFVLLREKVEPVEMLPHEAIRRRVAVSLLKPPSEQLGIKITGNENGKAGIYILELVPGCVAHTDGQLEVGDRILEIANVDLYDESPETAARVIQNAGERIDIVVSKTMSDLPVTIKNQWATDKTLPRGMENPARTQPAPPKSKHIHQLPAPDQPSLRSSYQEKMITVKKSANESLGIVVAGGMTGVRGDLPVFVQDIQPMGILGKDKRLQRGDLLVQINGVKLTGLSHSQAIAVLKDTARHCKDVSLTAIELKYFGKNEDFALWEELSGVHHQRRRSGSLMESSWSSWTPSWKMWLAVPPQCRMPRDVVIKKGLRGGLGFSIVGGQNHGGGPSSPVFVKYVVPNSPAAVQGGIRCGDEIVAINGVRASSMSHASVVQALKRKAGTVLVSIMSWPGSVH